MTEKLAQYFLEVYKNRNIALAAETLFVSRPVISRSIAEIEREFGTELFTRTRTGVEPTDAGTMVYKMLCEVIACYSAAKNGIEVAKNGAESHTLRLGVTPTNAMNAYDILFRGFLDTHPDVIFNIVEKSASESISLLLNNEADAVFTPWSFNEPFLDFIDGYKVQFSLGVSKNSPLASRHILSIIDIIDVTFGSLIAPLPLDPILNSSFAVYGKTPNIAVRCSSLDLLRKLVQEERVAVVFPDDIMNGWEGVATIPVDFIKASTHRLVWSKLALHNSVFDDFITYAEGIFRDKQLSMVHSSVNTA